MADYFKGTLLLSTLLLPWLLALLLLTMTFGCTIPDWDLQMQREEAELKWLNGKQVFGVYRPSNKVVIVVFDDGSYLKAESPEYSLRVNASFDELGPTSAIKLPQDNQHYNGE